MVCGKVRPRDTPVLHIDTLCKNTALPNWRKIKSNDIAKQRNHHSFHHHLDPPLHKKKKRIAKDTLIANILYFFDNTTFSTRYLTNWLILSIGNVYKSGQLAVTKNTHHNHCHFLHSPPLQCRLPVTSNVTTQATIPILTHHHQLWSLIQIMMSMIPHLLLLPNLAHRWGDLHHCFPSLQKKIFLNQNKPSTCS